MINNSTSYYMTNEALWIFDGNAEAQYPGERVIACGISTLARATGAGTEAIAIGHDSVAQAVGVGARAIAMRPEAHCKAYNGAIAYRATATEVTR